MRRAVGLTIIGVVLGWVGAAAQGSWLDGEPANWNVAGAAIPSPPETLAEIEIFPPCERFVRAAESPEEAGLYREGWLVVGAAETGWGVRLVTGAVGFDGMCRPFEYQDFVFVDGRFAGTLAPAPMVSRSDGALVDSGISTEERLFARFVRYAPADPLCCPSGGEEYVGYAIERTAAGPLVVPEAES